jgi:hypothetical protein
VTGEALIVVDGCEAVADDCEADSGNAFLVFLSSNALSFSSIFLWIAQILQVSSLQFL